MLGVRRWFLAGALVGAAAALAAARLLPAERAALVWKEAAPSSTADAARAATVVARVGDGVITVGEVEAHLRRQAPFVRARYVDPDRRRELLDSIVRARLQLAEAVRRGLGADPEVVRGTEDLLIQRLANQTMEAVRAEDLGEADLRGYYAEHRDELETPEQVRVSAIRLADAATAAEVAKQARGGDDQAFRALVARYSLDAPSKTRGGDLGYLSADTEDVPPEVSRAAFRLRTYGQVAGPIATSAGYFVLKQSGRRPAQAAAFESVETELRSRMLRERRAAALDRLVRDLSAATSIDVDEAALAGVRVLGEGAAVAGTE